MRSFGEFRDLAPRHLAESGRVQMSCAARVGVRVGYTKLLSRLSDIIVPNAYLLLSGILSHLWPEDPPRECDEYTNKDSGCLKD